MKSNNAIPLIPFPAMENIAVKFVYAPGTVCTTRDKLEYDAISVLGVLNTRKFTAAKPAMYGPRRQGESVSV